MEVKNKWLNDSESRYRETFLVAGGPSLKGFDFDKLRGRSVIAINDALLQLPWATAMFSADKVWVSKRHEQIKAFTGEKYIAVTEVPSNHIAGVHYLDKIRATGLSLSPDAVHVSGSSGYGALNLAFILGAKKITLLGFDYKESSQHWYNPNHWNKTKNNISFPLWTAAFDSTVEVLQQHSVIVLNASVDSAVTAFPKIDLSLV